MSKKYRIVNIDFENLCDAVIATRGKELIIGIEKSLSKQQRRNVLAQCRRAIKKSGGICNVAQN